DRNRSHWSTSKTPSYTKSVSWQHHLTAELARKEGEGDLSLEYWRNEHRRFFQAEGSYSPEMDVIFEEYALIDVV
ncbi:ASCH domain-containing protein, partial [Escherichia sp. Lx600-2]|uniref:ASCH domain-containing protein n=1 Tax=Escherichia sp. Lx600-2 TaxID=2994672 RepID=UPI002FC6544D